MADKLKIRNSVLRLEKCDYTDMEFESIVFYARNDLKLGAGFGNAISVRGGPSIQEELDAVGSIETTKVAVTSAGEMKARWIIHAAGPAFMEENLEEKLRDTVNNCLRLADEKGLKSIAFPPMGTGFHGVPLEMSAAVTIGTIRDYLSGDTGIEEVVVCLLDSREYTPFSEELNSRVTV